MRLAEHTEKESLGEMKHAQEAIDRILYFNGVPNMQKYMKINVGKTVPEMMRVDHNLELDAVKRLNRGIALATEKADNGSGALFERIRFGGGAHRLARGPDPADQGPRDRKLPGPADRALRAHAGRLRSSVQRHARSHTTRKVFPSDSVSRPPSSVAGRCWSVPT